MFGKVLLLALVCVAASEVRENDLQCETEEALKQAAATFRKLSNTIHRTIEIYHTGYYEFYKIYQAYWGIVWEYAYKELKEVEIASLELTEMAKEQNRPEEVFACIAEKTQTANEVLKVMPWTFDRRLEREVNRHHDDHYKIVEIAYEYMHTYIDYYWDNIVKSLKECENNECLEEILNKYEEEYEQKSEVLAEVVKKLDVHATEFPQVAKSMLSAVRGTFTFARITGVDDIKKCMTVSN